MTAEQPESKEAWAERKRSHHRRTLFIGGTCVLACVAVALLTVAWAERHEDVTGTAANGLPYPPASPYNPLPDQVAGTPLPDDIYAQAYALKDPAINTANILLDHAGDTNGARTKVSYNATQRIIAMSAIETDAPKNAAASVEVVFQVGDVNAITVDPNVTTDDIRRALGEPGIDVTSAGAWNDSGDWIRLTNTGEGLAVTSDERTGDSRKIIEDPAEIPDFVSDFTQIADQATLELYG
jgi:hypothetical protein